LGELAQRRPEASIGHVEWHYGLDRLGQAVAQSAPPVGRAAVGREHAPSNPQQPGQRLARDLLRLPPSDGERFRRYVICDLRWCSAAGVREHGLVVLTKDRF
jgi:hypothetical protein